MRRILCLGDSNTYGYDPGSFMGSRYPADVRWTGILKTAGYEVVNCGQNGMSVPGTASIPALCRMQSSGSLPDAVTVMYGSNDLLMGASAEQTAFRMENLLQALTAAGDSIVILLAPPPMRPGTWVENQNLIRESVRLAKEYSLLAEKLGIPFGDAGKWDVSPAFDGVHFTPEGHAAFARGMLELLVEAGL